VLQIKRSRSYQISGRDIPAETFISLNNNQITTIDIQKLMS
jgi:hypothetical protein